MLTQEREVFNEKKRKFVCSSDMDLSTIEYYSTQRRYGFKFHLFNSDSLIALPNPQVKEETSKFDVRQIFFAIFDSYLF